MIDVAGGDDIPRKRGPGVIRADLLVVNKIDLAPYVGVDLAAMLERGPLRSRRPAGGTRRTPGPARASRRSRHAIARAVLFTE